MLIPKAQEAAEMPPVNTATRIPPRSRLSRDLTEPALFSRTAGSSCRASLSAGVVTAFSPAHRRPVPACLRHRGPAIVPGQRADRGLSELMLLPKGGCEALLWMEPGMRGTAGVEMGCSILLSLNFGGAS